MVGTIRLLNCISISLLALSACGGGGSSSSSSSSPPPPLIPAGTFLAAPGTTCTGSACTGPEASYTFTGGGAFGTGSSSAGGAQVTLTTDGTGKTSRVSINVPAGSGNYSHTFDLTNTGVRDTGPFAGFISAQDIVNSDGTFRNQIILDPNLTYSSYGFWTNIPVSSGAGSTGALAFGQLTPTANIPKTGSLTYTGNTIGSMIDGTTTTPLVGTESLTANFGATTPNVTGTFNINTVAPSGATTHWTNLAISVPGASIVNSTYAGTVTGSITSGTGSVSGPINGTFNGPTAQETAGTWSVSDGASIHAVGGYGAKR
jgi:hypothetical protein